MIETAAKELGAPIRSTGFVRFALGEGIDEAERRFRRRSRRPAGRQLATAADVRGRSHAVRRDRLRTSGARWRVERPMTDDRRAAATLSPRAAEDLRRGADGRPATTASTRRCVERIADEVQRCTSSGVELCLVIGGGNIFRGMSGAAVGIERATGRLHGHAGDRHQRARHAERARAARRAHPRAVGDPDGVGLRALYPPPRDPPHGEGPGRDLRRRHRQPVLHDRHGGGAARRRDGLRRAAQGHQGRRRLHRRSEARTPAPSASTGSTYQRCWRATSRSWTPRRSRWRAKTAFRSSCSRSASTGGFAEVLRGKGALHDHHRRTRTQARWRRRHDRSRTCDGSASTAWTARSRCCSKEFGGPAHRPRLGEPARADQRRRLRQRDAAQPGRHASACRSRA